MTLHDQPDRAHEKRFQDPSTPHNATEAVQPPVLDEATLTKLRRLLG